jgi:DNA invertase Pin-like site-specific DNA recombinase
LGTDVDPFVLHILCIAGKKERQLISGRTQEGGAKKAGTGLLGNKKNLGVAQARGAAAYVAASVEFSRKMMGLLGNLKDGISMNAIAKHLNAMSVPTMRGGKWTATAVSCVKASYHMQVEAR